MTVANGWGIPTATDIALAWLVARVVFGRGHSAVSFLLLLAVADDGIGLGIIAVFYPDPNHPVQTIWLLLVAAGMGVAWGMRSVERPVVDTLHCRGRDHELAGAAPGLCGAGAGPGAGGAFPAQFPGTGRPWHRVCGALPDIRRNTPITPARWNGSSMT